MPLQSWWIDARARGYQLTSCVAYTVVDDGEAVIIMDVAGFLESVGSLSARLVGCVEMLCDAANGVATLHSENDLCRHVVEYLVYLVVTNCPVTDKPLTRVCFSLGRTAD